MTYRIVRLGGKVVEFPITFRDRMEGESKFSGSIVREALLLVIKLWIADFDGRRRRRALGG
jgi:dolichol-phosphate mannosyltransferase